MSDMIEKVARAIAKDNGDNFDAIPQDKQDWIANHSATGRFRDVNEPRRDDYLSMARAAIESMREPDTLAIEEAVSAHLAWRPNRNTPRTACQDFGMQQREILTYQTKAALDAYFAALSQSQSPNTADTTSTGDA